MGAVEQQDGKAGVWGRGLAGRTAAGQQDRIAARAGFVGGGAAARAAIQPAAPLPATQLPPSLPPPPAGARAGLAHLLEHMAFKGTAAIGTTDAAAEGKVLDALDEAFYEVRCVNFPLNFPLPEAMMSAGAAAADCAE